jgi:hypothetical protein
MTESALISEMIESTPVPNMTPIQKFSTQSHLHVKYPINSTAEAPFSQLPGLRDRVNHAMGKGQ